MPKSGTRHSTPPEMNSEQARSSYLRSERFEEDFVALLDEQDERRKQTSRKVNFILFGLFGVAMASMSVWYVVSRENQRKVADLILDIKASGNDFQMISSPTGLAHRYDAALAQIETRAEDIDKASNSLGVDPKTVTEDGMDIEMKQMMGGKGRTTAERDKLLRGQLGKFAGLKKKTEAPPESAPSDGKPASPTAKPPHHEVPVTNRPPAPH